MNIATTRVVNPDEPFMTRQQAYELMELCSGALEINPNDYFAVRFDAGNSRQRLTHEEALLVIPTDISAIACFRLKAAGVSMQDVAKIAYDFYHAEVDDSQAVYDDYTEMRCRYSLSRDEAFERLYAKYGVEADEDDEYNDWLNALLKR